MTTPTPEYRYDPLQGEWVIVSSVRSERPDEFASSPRERAACPFCPGEEHRTPEEIAARRNPDDTWRLRVVPNKFPALCCQSSANDASPAKEQRLYGSLPGFGSHEVVIETPQHVSAVHERPLDDIESLLQMYAERVEALYANPRLHYVSVFRNSGAAAGASLVHPHSQIIAMDRLPPLLTRRLDASHHHYHEHRRCMLCDITEAEVQAGSRLLHVDDHCVAFCPPASRFPYQILLVARTHNHDFSASHPEDLRALASALRTLVGYLHRRLDAPAYNWLLHTAPNPARAARSAAEVDVEGHFHTYIEIFPRQTRVAGFEWSTGFFINPVPPEVAARNLRDATPKPS
jgi:UDPglucose--hexose-1-phosphate uridylyltransferase